MEEADKEVVKLDEVEGPDAEATGYAAAPAITMGEFAEALLMNDLTKDRFSVHSDTDGAWLLDLGEGEQAEITFNRDIYDRHSEVQFLTYGHPVLESLIEDVNL